MQVSSAPWKPGLAEWSEIELAAVMTKEVMKPNQMTVTIFTLSLF